MDVVGLKGSRHCQKFTLVSVRIQIVLLDSLAACDVTEQDRELVNVGSDLAVQSSSGPRHQLS
jgi:hypothetical protein